MEYAMHEFPRTNLRKLRFSCLNHEFNEFGFFDGKKEKKRFQYK